MVSVEPTAGYGPVDAVITSARHSVDVVMYEFADTTAEHALTADASRGVDVQVLLSVPGSTSPAEVVTEMTRPPLDRTAATWTPKPARAHRAAETKCSGP